MQHRTVLLVAVVVLSVIGGPVAGLAAADDVTLEVLVQTAAGAPVGDAELTASVDGEVVATATTVSNGRAFMDVPDGAEVTIEVDHPSYVRNDPFTIENATAREVTVPVWEKASATISVADAEGPVEGVRVVFRKGGDIVGVHPTNASGMVDSGIIEAGEYTVTFFEPGYLRKAVTLQVQDQISQAVTIEQASVTVEFRVLDDTFDPPKPIANADISGADFSTQTQPDGRAGAVVPVNTELSVTVQKADYETVQRTVVVREQDREVNITTRKRDAVHLDVANERVVAGETLQVTVTDEYGEPLADATLYLDGEPVGQSDADGTLRVTIESAGDHTLFAQSGQLSSTRVTVTGVESGDVDSTAAQTTAAPDRVTLSPPEPEPPAGFFKIPGLGPIHLRSILIGAALGLVLAAVLFIYTRSG